MADYTQIIQEINTNLPNNNTQAITAAKLRTTLIDFVNQVDSNEDNIETTLQGKQDSLTFDSIPTYNSANPVTSGGIANAIDEDFLGVSIFSPNIYTATTNSAVSALPLVLDPNAQSIVRKRKIYAIAANFNRTGTFSVCKVTNFALGGLVSESTITPIQVFNVTTTGFVILTFETPISLNANEWLAVGNNTDTAIFKHTRQAELDYRKGRIGFSYRNGSQWSNSFNNDAAIGLFDESLKLLIDNQIPAYENENKLLFSAYRSSHLFSGNATVSPGTYVINPDIVEHFRQQPLAGVILYGVTPGTYSIGKISNFTPGGTYVASNITLIKTFTIKAGINVLKFDSPIVLADNENIVVGLYANNGRIAYYNNTNRGDFNFYYIQGNNWSSTLTGASLCVGLFGEDTNSLISNLALESNNKYYGKSIGTLGDSITYGFNATHPWGYYLCQTLGSTLTNYGVSGTTVADCSTSEGAPFYQRAVNMASTLDVVFVLGGVNDFSKNVPLGTQFTQENPLTPNLDTSTFYGALNTMCLTLLSKYVDKEIYLMSPIKRGTYGGGSLTSNIPNSLGVYLSEYAEAVLKVAAYYGIKSFDLFSLYPNPNVQIVQQTYFNHNYGGSIDALHPDTNGQQRLAQTIISCLNI